MELSIRSGIRVWVVVDCKIYLLNLLHCNASDQVSNWYMGSQLQKLLDQRFILLLKFIGIAVLQKCVKVN